MKYIYTIEISTMDPIDYFDLCDVIQCVVSDAMEDEGRNHVVRVPSSVRVEY